MVPVTRVRESLLPLVVYVLAVGSAVRAAPPDVSPPQHQPSPRLLSLAQAPTKSTVQPSETKREKEKVIESKSTASPWDLDEFFNVRQADPELTTGEMELEVGLRWFTKSDEGDDDFLFRTELEYGLSEDAFAEIAFSPINIGDGGDQGNGDLELGIFNRFVRESDGFPSLALWGDVRIPSGQESSGVDGELHLTLTKTIVPKFRTHFDGFVESANGGRTEEEKENGRHFQWGLGLGFDYEFSDRLLGIVNYLNRVSEEYGEGNQNMLELGLNYRINAGHRLKAAVDVGLSGVEGEPNFGAKLQYEIELRR